MPKPTDRIIQALLIIIIVLAVGIWWLLSSSTSTGADAAKKPQLDQTIDTHDPLEQAAPEQKNQQPQQPLQVAQPDTAPSQSIESPEKCIEPRSYANDPRHDVINRYIKEDYLGLHVDYVNYLNEQELLALAEEGNVRAMLILGLNYRWNARMESFQAKMVRPPELDRPNYKIKEKLDLTIMAKSRYWLARAAVNGQVAALAQIASNYRYQAVLLKKETDENDQQDTNDKKAEYDNLIAHDIAYQLLHHKMAPQLSNYDDLEPIDPKIQPQVDKIYAQIENSWNLRRTRLGLPIQYELNLPPEFEEIEKLRDQICPQNRERQESQ